MFFEQLALKAEDGNAAAIFMLPGRINGLLVGCYADAAGIIRLPQLDQCHRYRVGSIKDAARIHQIDSRVIRSKCELDRMRQLHRELVQGKMI
ncbi:hypothetical protein SDC9_178280 [bioreactor metagenome]|uniref:Uncharacterized protein n=1 Tax=bioreactor metagenome TaxID=1076179 RepID=A0A645GYJ8_9ZZZZ